MLPEPLCISVYKCALLYTGFVLSSVLFSGIALSAFSSLSTTVICASYLIHLVTSSGCELRLAAFFRTANIRIERIGVTLHTCIY